MLHTLNPCNNSCNTPFSTISGHHPSPLRSRRSRPTPAPSCGIPPDPLRRCPGITPSPDPGTGVRSRVRRPPRRWRPFPWKDIVPPEWHLESLRCHGDGRQVSQACHGYQVSQNQRERGFCGCGRRLPLRGLPDGPTLHEDPPEGCGLCHSSSLSSSPSYLAPQCTQRTASLPGFQMLMVSQ